MMEKETFRADLFYRLNVLPIHLPSLRERREDIESLVKYLIEKFNRIHSRRIKGINTDALNALRMYNWPGNIRELENVIEHAFIIESSDKINLESLPANIRQPGRSQPLQHSEATSPSASGLASSDESDLPASSRDGADAASMLSDFSDLKYPVLKERFEKEFIIRALKAFNGRINQTAEHTQMTKVTLLRKLEKYGINPREYQR
jgi:DNA-binding NtrC family response regulator